MSPEISERSFEEAIECGLRQHGPDACTGDTTTVRETPPPHALVAFPGKVEDGGRSYTEAGMNGFPEAQTATTFGRPENRFLIVANKFQTGFDQPLLHTMYVDKKLGGVNAVQTLSRLNRTLPPEKQGTTVLDFANEAAVIKAAFEPYYETTLLSEATDPNLLYESQTRLAAFPVYTEADVDGLAKVYFDPKATQDRIYAVLAPAVERFRALSEEEQHDFRGQITDYVRLYAFLAQVLTFADADLEKLYVFARHLRRLLPADRAELPREVQQNIDMESYRIQQTGNGKIALERKPGILDPAGTTGGHGTAPEELETLSRITAELNERFGLKLGPEHRVTLVQMMETTSASPRWNLKEDRQDDKGVTHAVLKTIAAFLNTEGGDLLIGVADDGSIVGIERDGIESDDKFMRHLAQAVRNGLGDRTGTCIDPKTQIVQGKRFAW